MNSYTFKNLFIRLFPLFGLLATAACNQLSSDREGFGGFSMSEEFFGGKGEPLPQAITDSLFVQQYISKEPEFKEHEDFVFLFYGERDYKLAWFQNNELLPQAEQFFATIDQAAKEGLDPADYRVVNIDKMLQQYRQLEPQDSARLELQQKIDLALTASYFNYASDFYRGRVDPRADNEVNWYVKENKVKLHKALQAILEERDSTYPYSEFDALHEGYTRLRDKLQEYRDLEAKGGWPVVDLGNRKLLKKGDTADAVLTLRKRLNPAERLHSKDPSLRVYDERLAEQVKHFQMLHGLKQDGLVDGTTLAMLNVPVEERIKQIQVNMERWRWLPKRLVPKKLDQKYVWVNIPEYRMYVYEDPNNDPEAERQYKEVMNMKVIVGKTMHSTPIFSDKLEYVVMAPYWNVPNSIVANEIRPHMLKNPAWLARQNMEVVTREKNPRTISPYSINWSTVTEESFPYRVRQKPGPNNSLGMIKFIFPNQYAVYLHDTPADALFSETNRDFSHGCVRVERPVDFAKYLLQDMPEWDESTIRNTMRNGEEEWITLPKRVQVYIVYFTSWVDDKGEIHFLQDLYGHDKKLEQEYFG